MKHKVLFILHLPPPIHGAAMVGKYIQDSKLINSSFNCEYINFSLSENTSKVGKFSLRKVINYLFLLFKIIKKIIQSKPDLCYITPSALALTFSGLLKDLIIIMLVKLFGVKIVFHFHNKGLSINQDKWLYNKLYRIFFKDSNIILLSQRLFNDFEEYVNKENVYICPNGIPQLINSKNSSHRLNILFLSNMIASKGVWILLDACRELKNDRIDFECHFVGKWTDITAQEFKEKVDLYNLNKNIFSHGALYGIDKNKYLSQADLFVFPTHYPGETFGLVLLEAMQFSLPCITSCEGGIPDIIENEINGFAIEKITASQLHEKIVYLYENPEVRQRMGAAGKQKFEKYYTLEAFENQLNNIISKILMR